MEIREAINNLTNTEIIKIVGIVITLLIAVLGLIFRAIIVNWKNNFSVKLAKIESKSSERETFLSNFSNTANVSQEKRIESIGEFWSTVLELKDCLSSTGQLMYSIMTKEEMKDFFGNNIYQNVFMGEVNDPNLHSRFSELLRKAEIERPFIGEKIWFNYTLLLGFVGRTIYLFEQSVKKRELIFWLDDKYPEEVLFKYLRKSELDLIKSNRSSSFKYTLEILEQRILKEIDLTLSGKRTSVDSIKMARELSDISNRENWA
jgi:hypothetical protein